MSDIKIDTVIDENSVERSVFHVDVGDITPDKATEYIEKVASELSIGKHQQIILLENEINSLLNYLSEHKPKHISIDTLSGAIGMSIYVSTYSFENGVSNKTNITDYSTW